MIRRATLADVEPMIDMLMRVKRASVYATVSVDKDRARKQMRQCISAPQAYAGVAEVDGKIVGALLGIKDPLWFSRMLEAKDIVFGCVDPKVSTPLLRDFIAWAWRDPRVVNVLMSQSSGQNIERTQQWFASQGFEVVGGVFRLGRYDEQQESAA
jgi:hypothetical protein